MMRDMMRDEGFSGAGRCWIAVLTIGALAGSGPLARGELTVESLTGTAVSGVGPYVQDVGDAIVKFRNRDFAGAFAYLEKAKKTTPRLAPPEIMMAQLYFDGNQPLGGITMLEKVILRLPQDPEAYLLLAERAVNERRMTEADFLFQKAVQLVEPFTENPRRKQNLQLRAYSGGASVDEGRADWKAAQAKLDALILLDEKNAAPHERLGRVRFAAGDPKGAYAELQLAAEADEKMLPAELAMAMLFRDKANSEKWLKFAIDKSGKDQRTQRGAATYLLRSNQLEKAKIHSDEALKLDPDNMETHLIAGVIARMLGDYQEAAGHLSKAHLHAPIDLSIINNLALVLVELGDQESQLRALQYAEMNVRLNSKNMDFLSTLGWVNYRLNRRTEAQRAFTAILNSNEMGANPMINSEISYYLAHLTKDKGDIPEAVKLLTEALDTDQPFAYRKKAEELLAQLSKLDKSPKPKGSKTPGPPKKNAPKNDEPANKAADTP